MLDPFLIYPPALLSDTSPVPCLSSPRDYHLQGSTQPTHLLGSIAITFVETLACLKVLGLHLLLPPILCLGTGDIRCVSAKIQALP